MLWLTLCYGLMAQWAHHSNYGSVPISIPKYLAQSEEGWDVQDPFPSPGFALLLEFLFRKKKNTKKVA